MISCHTETQQVESRNARSTDWAFVVSRHPLSGRATSTNNATVHQVTQLPPQRPHQALNSLSRTAVIFLIVIPTLLILGCCVCGFITQLGE